SVTYGDDKLAEKPTLRSPTHQARIDTRPAGQHRETLHDWRGSALDVLRLTEELLARDAVKAVASRFTYHFYRHSNYVGARQDSIARVCTADVLVHRSCPMCNIPAASPHLDRAGRRSGCGRALTLRRSARARALSIPERSSSESVWPREGTACSTAAFRTSPLSPAMVSVPLFSLGCARRSTTQRMPPPRGRASGTVSNGVSGAPRKRTGCPRGRSRAPRRPRRERYCCPFRVTSVHLTRLRAHNSAGSMSDSRRSLQDDDPDSDVVADRRGRGERMKELVIAEGLWPRVGPAK